MVLGDWQICMTGQRLYQNDGHSCNILSYKVDCGVHVLTGCSGYVAYEMGHTVVTFAFSNPTLGWNKLGVGTAKKINAMMVTKLTLT